MARTYDLIRSRRQLFVRFERDESERPRTVWDLIRNLACSLGFGFRSYWVAFEIYD